MPEETPADTKPTKANEPKTLPKPPAAPASLGVHDVTRIPVTEDLPPKESPLPEARVEVGRTAFERQLPQNRSAAPRKRRFAVSLGDEQPTTVVADSPNDAWAIFCDARKEWPSPRVSNRKIEDLGPVPVSE